MKQGALKNYLKDEQGAALLTVSVILALVSVFLVLGLRMFATEQPVDRYRETKTQMEFVVDQMTSYVHRERRLPCPAAPNADPLTVQYGREDRTGGAGSNGACARNFGIIPFQTLNLTHDFARDSWGRFITYAISPVFGDTRNPAAANQIFYICRKEDWFDDAQIDPEPVPPEPASSKNISKARFCCPGVALYDPDTDLVILDELGNQFNLRPDQNPAPPAAGATQRTEQNDAFGTLISPGPGAEPDVLAEPIQPVLTQQRNVIAFAMALVSHGSNGQGAFDGTGPLAVIPVAGASAAEAENGDLDITFIDRPAVLVEGANYYDDIVVWRSQFSLYNELNNASCARPWR